MKCIYREELKTWDIDIEDKKALKESRKKINYVVEKMNKCLQMLENDLKAEFKELFGKIEHEHFRNENIMTEGKPPTLFIYTYITMDGCWSDYVSNSRYKFLTNAYLDYIREILKRNDLLFDEFGKMWVEESNECYFCSKNIEDSCSDDRRKDELISGIHNCEYFFYDSRDKKSKISKKTKPRIEGYYNFRTEQAKIIRKINKTLDLNYYEDYLKMSKKNPHINKKGDSKNENTEK